MPIDKGLPADVTEREISDHADGVEYDQELEESEDE